MTVWKIGIETTYTTYDQLKTKHVVAQGWSSTGDLSYLFRKDNDTISRWLKKLLPTDNKGQNPLTNLLGLINTNDLVLGYEGIKLKGICEIPENAKYIYEEGNEYSNCLYPVIWIDWQDFLASVQAAGRVLDEPGAGTRGIPGIVRTSQATQQQLELAWGIYLNAHGNNLNPPDAGNIAVRVDEIHEDWPSRVIQSLGGFNCHMTQAKAKHLADVIGVTKQLILYGPPGTGKTYIAKALAAELLKEQLANQLNLDIDPCKADEELEIYRFDPRQYTGFWDIVQFHPSYAYEDFIGGIRPILQGQGLGYALAEGIFKRMCDVACLNPSWNYILIIDEINRADLPSVFGELLYALEYRGNAVNLPHFGAFTIPPNVFIIGTTAVRRFLKKHR